MCILKFMSKTFTWLSTFLTRLFCFGKGLSWYYEIVFRANKGLILLFCFERWFEIKKPKFCLLFQNNKQMAVFQSQMKFPSKWTRMSWILFLWWRLRCSYEPWTMPWASTSSVNWNYQVKKFHNKYRE